jgi:hypothetical protein
MNISNPLLSETMLPIEIEIPYLITVVSSGIETILSMLEAMKQGGQITTRQLAKCE